MKDKVYFKLQLKKALKIYPVILLITAITLASIAITGAILINNSINGENKQKLSVGVVGDIEGNYLGVGLYALENFDDARFSFDFIEMEEDEAVEALKNGTINGYADIPDGFLNSILYGRNNCPVNYVMLNKPSGFTSVLAEEFTEVISNMVIETQRAIYSMQEIAQDYNKTDNLYEKTDAINYAFFDYVLNRSGFYEVKDLSINDKVSMGGYYICGIFLFFLLMWGISCNKLLSGKNYTLSRTLNSSGLSTVKQMICEYAAYAAVTLITVLILAAVFGIAVQKNSLGIREIEDVDVISCIMFVIRLLPVIVMITMMQFAFYEFISNTIGAVLMQFLTAVVLGYISGCFYPSYFFPQAVQEIASVLPSGIAFSYMQNVMAHEPIWTGLLQSAVYTALFALLACFARKRKMQVI